jgi:hypothetical protein
VEHAGQGQGERAPSASHHHLRGLDSACSVGSWPAPEGTRSRRCGRRLTGERRERLTSGRNRNGGTDSATPADWATWPPLASWPFVRCSRLPGCASTCHKLISQLNNWWVEKPGPVSVSQPTLDKESGLQPFIRSPNTLPSLLIRVKLQGGTRVLRCLFQQRATPLRFSIVHCLSFWGGKQAPVFWNAFV